VLASFRAVRPRVEPDPLNAKALRQRALVCCKGTLAAFCASTSPAPGARRCVCASDMLVLIRWQGRNLAVPLSQLAAVDADESTAEAIGDWHYWVAQGYRF